MGIIHQTGDLIAQRYRLICELGSGGSGISYEAEDQTSRKTVVVKVLLLSQVADWSTLDLFEREAQVLAQLNHPAIPQYIEAFHTDTATNRALYIVRELAPGQSLYDWVQQGWRGDEATIKDIAVQVLKILLYLQSQRPAIIHRDIKPQNLIRDQHGGIRLVDFGAVQSSHHTAHTQVAGAHSARTGTVVGTFGYMAPEQFWGRAQPATDLYGLGATLLFLLTHRSPADLPSDGLNIQFRSAVSVSEGFAQWLEQLLAPDLADRFPSANAALSALQNPPKIAPTMTTLPWAKVGPILGAIALLLLGVNHQRWRLMSSLNLLPYGICREIQVTRTYFRHGGRPAAQPRIAGVTPSTLLSCALSYSNFEIADVMLENGVNIDQPNPNSDLTPLHQAVRSRRLETARFLVERGANLNATTEAGQTPLHLAVRQQQLPILELLLAHGAEVNVPDQDGITALGLVEAADIDPEMAAIATLLRERGGTQ